MLLGRFLWEQNLPLTIQCVCAVVPVILGVRLVDVPAGATQDVDHTGLHLPYAVIAFIFIARRIRLSFSLVDREVEFCVPTKFVLYWLGMIFFFFFFARKNPLQSTCTRAKYKLLTFVYCTRKNGLPGLPFLRKGKVEKFVLDPSRCFFL